MSSKPDTDTRLFLHTSEMTQDDIPTVPNFRLPSGLMEPDAPTDQSVGEAELRDEIRLLSHRVDGLGREIRELSEMLLALVQEVIAPEPEGAN